MKQKTAIRQLIEYLNNEVKLGFISQDIANRIIWYSETYFESINEQQIVDAVNNTNLDSNDDPDLGQYYFNQTFEKP